MKITLKYDTHLKKGADVLNVSWSVISHHPVYQYDNLW